MNRRAIFERSSVQDTDRVRIPPIQVDLYTNVDESDAACNEMWHNDVALYVYRTKTVHQHYSRTFLYYM